MTFEPSNIIVRDDSIYPRGALVVHGYDESGSLLAHPLGGGPQLIIPVDAQARFSLVSRDEATPIFCRTTFSMEGLEGTRFDGWTDGRTWNGWTMPRFELDAALGLAAQLEGQLRYDKDEDAFVNVTGNIGDDEEIWGAETIALADGGTIKVYPIGAGSWIWDECEHDPLDGDES